MSTPASQKPLRSLGRLFGVCGPYRGKSAELTGGQVRIGRQASLELCLLDDPEIADLHAGLIFQDGTWYIFDLGSASGTMVDGVPVENRLTPLSAGAVIQVGSHGFRLDYEPAPALRPIRTTRVRPPDGLRLEFGSLESVVSAGGLQVDDCQNCP